MINLDNITQPTEPINSNQPIINSNSNSLDPNPVSVSSLSQPPVEKITSSISFKELLANIKFPTEKATSWKNNLKVKRVLEERNKAASVTRRIKNVNDEIELHAFLRLQHFYTTCLAYYKKGQGFEKPPRFRVGPARMQVGKSEIRGSHAAHHNALAGLSDNFVEMIADELKKQLIESEKNKTFVKFNNIAIKILLAKGIDFDVINKVIEGRNPEVYNNIFESLKKQASILDKSDLDVSLNATTALPRRINLGLDKRIENNLRKYQLAIQLLEKVSTGEITPENATIKLAEMIQVLLEHRLKIFEEEKGKLKKASDTKKNRQSIEAMNNQINEYKAELKGTVVPQFEKISGIYNPVTKTFEERTSEELEEYGFLLIANSDLDKEKLMKNMRKVDEIYKVVQSKILEQTVKVSDNMDLNQKAEASDISKSIDTNT